MTQKEQRSTTDNYEELKEMISDMAEEGQQFTVALGRYSDEEGVIKNLMHEYQQWYSKALVIVKQIIPDRVSEFEQLYRNEKRKCVNSFTYTISDALKDVRSGNEVWGDCYGPKDAAVLVYQQSKILLSCIGVLESRATRLQTTLQANIMDSELASAKRLRKMGFMRAAGAICAVILEKHLSAVCYDKKVSVGKGRQLTDYNNALKDVVYDFAEWRKTERLADLCKLCDRGREPEPGDEEIDELIAGTDKVIKTVF